MRYLFSISILTIGLIASVSTVSCSKNALDTVTSISSSNSAIPAIVDTTVFASSWISFNSALPGGETENPSCSLCPLDIEENVPGLDANVTNGQKVLVYVKFANVEASVKILPTSSISLTTDSYQIEISTTRQNFSLTLFKYILIPSNALARTTNLDFSDYYAVVAYYKLPE
jgi:hypothetical protein